MVGLTSGCFAVMWLSLPDNFKKYKRKAVLCCILPKDCTTVENTLKKVAS